MSIQFFCIQKDKTEPSGSGYCQKLETFLRAQNFTDYKLVFTMPSKGPKGKIPWVVLDGKQTLADSHFIIKHLIQSKRVADPDAGLTAAQRAETRALQAYTEELLYPAVVVDRWFVDKNFHVLKRETFSTLPLPLYHFVPWLLRRRIRGLLTAAGIGRHSITEVHELIKEWVDSVKAQLGAHSGPFFYTGSEPTLIDIVLYGFLSNALGTKSNPFFTSLILESELLRKYVANLTQMWFPEYRPILNMVQ